MSARARICYFEEEQDLGENEEEDDGLLWESAER
jgi:hypothetical protein